VGGSTLQTLRPVLLDHNENAYGPSEKVRAVLAEAPAAGNRYPREEYEILRGKLAFLHSVKVDNVLLGGGSSEILRMAASAFTGPSKRLVQALPTYAALGRFAKAGGAEVVEVPLTKTYAHDLDVILSRVGDGNSAGLVYICNPNNPSGTLTIRRDIEAFIEKLPGNIYVLIDEAYCHFVSPHQAYASFLDRTIDNPRVIVCRTFSKVYGLAGMRIGYAVGRLDALKRLAAWQLHYCLPTLSARAAIAAVDDSAYVRAAIKRNADDRQEFMNQVNTRMLRPIDSHANFAMLNPLRSADMVVEHLKRNNILVAPIFPTMEKYIRVSLGTPDEMLAFWNAMDKLPPTDKMAM
jgi:histidinol-phosphate aminotransferase